MGEAEGRRAAARATEPRGPAAAADGGAPLVEIRGLTRRYREGDRFRTVLEGARASLAAGELVALLGPSGSGKSTLLNLVSGIDRPDAGEVRITGVPVTALSERERTIFRRRHVGFVFQFFNLLPTLSVLENLLFPLELLGRGGAEGKRQARALLAEVGLADRADDPPDRLSGGEQQRVAIARALVHDPLLVLADEPTGNLDPETAVRVLDLFERLLRARGRTLLVATHSPAVACRADRVLRIARGRLEEDAPPARPASDQPGASATPAPAA